MTIYLIRHGKTEANEKHLYCGSTDLSLSGAGKEELRSVHYDIKNVRFISSGMERANETLRILFGDHTTMGDDAGIILDFRQSFQYPRFHLLTAFPFRRNIYFVISCEPRLIFWSIFQLIVAVHLENAKIHFPETGINFIGYIAK